MRFHDGPWDSWEWRPPGPHVWCRIDSGMCLPVKFGTVTAGMCWEFPPQMALMISCDLINKDLVVKLYLFYFVFKCICNIFHWGNFVYGKDFYIERIYCQYFYLYIYCLLFVVFIRIYELGLSLSWNQIFEAHKDKICLWAMHMLPRRTLTVGWAPWCSTPTFIAAKWLQMVTNQSYCNL